MLSAITMQKRISSLLGWKPGRASSCHVHKYGLTAAVLSTCHMPSKIACVNMVSTSARFFSQERAHPTAGGSIRKATPPHAIEARRASGMLIH